MVLKLAMYGTYNSDIWKNFKPVLIIETVLIIMTFRKFQIHGVQIKLKPFWKQDFF